jgi:hypothetical protein
MVDDVDKVESVMVNDGIEESGVVVIVGIAVSNSIGAELTGTLKSSGIAPLSVVQPQGVVVGGPTSILSGGGKSVVVTIEESVQSVVLVVESVQAVVGTSRSFISGLVAVGAAGTSTLSVSGVVGASVGVSVLSVSGVAGA